MKPLRTKTVGDTTSYGWLVRRMDRLMNFLSRRIDRAMNNSWEKTHGPH